MTVCLGILCDEASKVVVAADRMVTGGDVEFEQDVVKIHGCAHSCVVLSAGSALRQVDLIRGARAKVGQQREPSVADVVEALKERFVETRRERAEDRYLKPLGMSLAEFIAHQGRLPESQVLRLTRNIETEELDLELIIAGVDNTGGHLYYLRDPGVADCFDAIGFCAIGSGERHAELSFIRSGYSWKVALKRAVFLAYQAKRDSELAPGVGSRFTDVAVIDENGFHLVHDDVLDILGGAYQELMGFHGSSHDAVQSRIDGLELRYQ